MRRGGVATLGRIERCHAYGAAVRRSGNVTRRPAHASGVDVSEMLGRFAGLCRIMCGIAKSLGSQHPDTTRCLAGFHGGVDSRWYPADVVVEKQNLASILELVFGCTIRFRQRD